MAAQAVAPDLRSLALVLLASSLGALLSRLSRRIVLPTVVVEIVLGILIGPEVLEIAEVDPYLQYLSTFGLALLFFFVGLEVVEQKVPRDSLARGTRGWGLSVAMGLAVGVVLQQLGLDARWWVLGIALTTTSLGALVPILGDAGVSRRRSALPSSDPAWPASSGRSSSSRCSSRARVGPWRR